MRKIRVLIAMGQPVASELLDKLRAVSPQLEIDLRRDTTVDEVADLLADMEVLYTDHMLPPESATPSLRWVQAHYAGIDHWDSRPLETSLIWTTTSGIHVHVAELVLTLILAFGRKLPLILDYQARADWSDERYITLMPDELRGSTVGIIGYGSIGRQVGALCQAFGMRVIATGREEKITHEPPWKLPGLVYATPDKIYDPADITPLLAESDYVVLAVPATRQTFRMINAETIRSMKSTAVLVNVARGSVVDEDALIEALKKGKIRGAGLDVFVEEPLPATSPFWRLPNVIVCPHVGGFSPHYISRSMEFFAENLRRYVAGEPLLNMVKKDRGY
jgi:phosphoglycerate dehydrogenase-like enzyme